MTSKKPSAPRCAALVGPYLSGKTTLLEAILDAAGAINRKGTVKEGNTVGDGAPEARAHSMSTEISVAHFKYLDEEWDLIDCPGSVDLRQESLNALMVVDAAVVVCDPQPERATTVAPLLKFLDDHDIPHILFINKIDTWSGRLRETLSALQAISERPLVLREIPIRENGEEVSGFIDLVSERAYKWASEKPSDLIKIPESETDREQEARDEMLESLADFDDALMEEILEDVVPSTEEIYQNLTKDLKQDLIVPVFFGSAEHENGVRRLMKALRHEAPEVEETAARLGLPTDGSPLAQAFRTIHAGHSGRMSLVRVWRGEVADGATIGSQRISGLYKLFGQKHEKQARAKAGSITALGRVEEITAGELLTESNRKQAENWPEPLKPLFALAIEAEKRADEVKLSGTLTKLVDEDPSLSFEQSQDTNELILWGQGEMHLKLALDRLKNRYGLNVLSRRPQVPYMETIKKPVSQHARHKKQSGGHGQFGDVHVDIKPLSRGTGFLFSQTVTGGAVPRQYFSAVESGIKDYIKKGPLGFPVVDISVTLTDGQHHAVDSSEMAFRAAGKLAMREGMPNCSPVLLEPVFQVTITIPNEHTSKIQRLSSGRRGKILGFSPKEGWKDWDEISVMMPQAEMFDLVVELRSLTMGVGTFDWSFDHLEEIVGKEADQVVAARAAAQK
jgi:elongation factor G